MFARCTQFQDIRRLNQIYSPKRPINNFLQTTSRNTGYCAMWAVNQTDCAKCKWHFTKQLNIACILKKNYGRKGKNSVFIL